MGWALVHSANSVLTKGELCEVIVASKDEERVFVVGHEDGIKSVDRERDGSFCVRNLRESHSDQALLTGAVLTASGHHIVVSQVNREVQNQSRPCYLSTTGN